MLGKNRTLKVKKIKEYVLEAPETGCRQHDCLGPWEELL